MNNIIKHIFICITVSGSLFFSPLQSIGGSISITWTGNDEPDLQGYYLYYGTSPGSYGSPQPLAANLTYYEITGLNAGTRYYIALSAYDFAYNESAKCPEQNGIAQSATSSSSSSSTSSSSTSTTIAPTTTTTTIYEGTELENNNNYAGSVATQVEDHYYIQVPPGQQLLGVSLAGNPDADLYVRFSAPPSQALWDCRPYTDDDSNEYCEFPNPSTGVYYIMVRGYSGTVNYNILAQYGSEPSTTSSLPPTTTTTVSTSTSIANTTSVLPLDTLPPTGTVSINAGQNLTNSQNVILYLSAVEDNGAPLGKNGRMSFSNDKQVWSDPEPFAEEKAWILSAGEGNKAVYALFGDAAGNWMTEPAQDEIIYQESQNTCNQAIQLSAASISASSESLPFFAKENAIDGDPSTSWSTLFRFFQQDEFFTMDLGEIKNITSLSMYSSRMFGTDLFPTNFQIQVSNDNLTWVDMETIQGYSTPMNPGSPDNWQYNGLACRFLKVSISKCRTFLFFLRVAQIAEIEVYGCGRDDQFPLISDENRSVRKEESPKNNADREMNSVNQQVPGIPGKPVIKFVN